MNTSKLPTYVFDELESSQRAELVADFGNLLSQYHILEPKIRESILGKYISRYGTINVRAYWLSFKKFAEHHRALTRQEERNSMYIQHFILLYRNIKSDLPHNTTDLEPIASMLESLHERISILEARIPTR